LVPRVFENKDHPDTEGIFADGGIGGIVCDALDDGGGRDDGGIVSLIDLREP
jgi:hypothetical protein